MHCASFAVVLFVLLLLLPLYVDYLSSHSHGCGCRKQGMVGWRQIRDDPNHTRYVRKTFEDTDPVLYYGGQQF